MQACALRARKACHRRPDHSASVLARGRGLAEHEGTAVIPQLRWLSRCVGPLALALLSACGSSEAPVEPPPVRTLSMADGNAERGAAGTPLPVPPKVLVQAADGSPLAGVEVRFDVIAGGGTVAYPRAQTDVDGFASAGRWTLGPQSALNKVSASIEGAAPVVFVAIGESRSAEVAVSMVRPTWDERVGEPVAVAARVASTYSVATVTVGAEGAPAASLAWDVATGTWTGAFALPGRPPGDLVLIVAATDVFGHVTEAVTPVRLDRPPGVSVGLPVDGTLARPSVAVQASCSDDGPSGCVELLASVDGVVLIRGADRLDGLVDLSAFEGREVDLVVTGTDSDGQQVSTSRRVAVESSLRLKTLVDLRGLVWDASTTQVLFADAADQPALRLMDVATGAEIVIDGAPDLNALGGSAGARGLVTPHGVVYWRPADPAGAGALAPWLYQWRNGAAARLAFLGEKDSLRRNGDWIAYCGDVSGGAGSMRQRLDLETGARASLSGPCQAGSVGDNGDVVWTALDFRYNDPSDAVFAWQGDTVRLLASGNAWRHWGPVAEGGRFVYGRYTRMTSQTQGQIAMHDGTVETVLSSFRGAAGSWAAAGGYVAYTGPDATGVRQVWRLAPDGSAAQITFFGSDSDVRALAPDGSLLIDHAGRRWLSEAGGLPVEVGSTLGRVLVRDGQFLVLFDHAVLQLTR